MKIFLVLLFATVTLCQGPIGEFKSINRWFSASFFKKSVKNAQGNFLVSPLSAETILALTQSGSRGPTAEEIRSTLNLPDVTKLETIFRQLPSHLDGPFHTLRSANKIYVQNNFPIRSDFLRSASEIYGAAAEHIDFSQKQAAATINAWVEKSTDDKIHDLIGPSTLNNRTRAVLVNGLYFKANWSQPFPIAYTQKLDFFVSPEEAVKVPIMLLHEKPFNYAENAGLKATFLELPFKGDASMVVVLPVEKNGLASLEKQMKKVLKPQRWRQHLFNVGLPRFKFETMVDLKAVLQKMGVEKAFDRYHADLSGIAGQPGDLVVDEVAQKTFIDVSEEGVEAAAATYALVAIPMSAPPVRPKNFRVDRPFIFYIKIKDVVVFVGRVTDPR